MRIEKNLEPGRQTDLLCHVEPNTQVPEIGHSLFVELCEEVEVLQRAVLELEVEALGQCGLW